MGYFDKYTVETAWGLVGPNIKSTLQQGFRGGYIKREHLAVIVTGTSVIHPQPLDVKFEDHLLLREAIGDPKQWEHNYDGIALAKARESVRTGQATATLPPHYLQKHDTVYWGSVVREDIVVACSGVQPYYDEMFSGWLADAIKAVAKDRFARYQDEFPEENYITTLT